MLLSNSVVFPCFSLADNLSIILGVSGACCLLLVIFVLLAFVRRRRKEQENLYKTWIIDIRDVTPSDDCDDSSVLFTNFIQVCMTQGRRLHAKFSTTAIFLMF